MCCIESKIQVGSNCTDSPATARSVSHPPSQDQQHEAYRLQNHPLRTGTLRGPFLGALSKAVYPRCGSRKRGGDRRGTGHQARGPRCSTDFTPSSVGIEGFAVKFTSQRSLGVLPGQGEPGGWVLQGSTQRRWCSHLGDGRKDGEESEGVSGWKSRTGQKVIE